MSGNVSKEGITADLEWMHRVGIGGMQMFDGDLGVARYLDKPVIWMTPEWKDAFTCDPRPASPLLGLIPHIQEFGVAGGGDIAATLVNGTIQC